MTTNSTALSLMRMALALLDRDGQLPAACHLQAAIDALEGCQPMSARDAISEADELRYLGPLPEREAASGLLLR